MATVNFSRSEAFTEESTGVITVSFTNEAGEAVTPASATWTLTKTSGEVVNSREDVSLTPASTVNIVLQGDDLALPEGASAKRILTVKATYNSTYGVGLPLNGACSFWVKNLVAV